MKRLFVCVLALVLFSAPWGTRAQDALRIAAVVNDEMISVYALNMRLNFVVAFAGLFELLHYPHTYRAGG